MVKLKIIFLFFALFLFIIICKLFYLQVINSHKYSADYLQTQKMYPDRGKILDSKYQPLVLNQTTYLLHVEPDKIKDKEETIKKIDEVLKIGEATLEAEINPAKKWVAIKHNVSKDQKDILEKNILTGIGFDPEQKRYYPEASLSAHLLGFVGKNDKGEDTGYFGVEGFYNQELVGLPGLVKSERDLLGRPMFIGTQERLDPEQGRDLVLTIDTAVQNIVKQKLKEGIDRSSAKQGCAIAVNPMTMEILALSCLPDYDPTNYAQYEQSIFNDQAISDIYEPGSTFKPIIMAAALDSGVVKEDSLFDEKGPVTVGDYTIKNYDDEYEGPITMSRILEVSSNVGMVYVGSKLGKDKMYQTLQKFGFGSPTGIDLEGESSGYIKPQSDWYPIDYSTAAFGQGIGITRIQLIRAFAAVINGGKLLRPYVVKEVDSTDGNKVREPIVERRVISEKTSAIMRKMLVSVVDAQHINWDRPKGYKIGGKTGTAQIAVQGHYDPSRTIASFIGFAPADQPKFLILVVLRDPGLSGFGSTTAAPIFFAITKELLSYYNIPPTE